MDSCGSFGIFESVTKQYCGEITKIVDFYVEKVLNNESNALESPIVVMLSIDYKKWSTVSEWNRALDTLLNEPLQSQKDIRRCVWMMIFSLFCERHPQLELSPQLHQTHCIIRFSNLPSNTEYKFAPFRHPVRLSLSQMRCVLHSFENCCALLRQTIWYCPKQCPVSKNLVISTEYSNVNNDKKINKCSICNEMLIENEVCKCKWCHRDSIYVRQIFILIYLFFSSTVVPHIRVDGFRFLMLSILRHLCSIANYIEVSV